MTSQSSGSRHNGGKVALRALCLAAAVLARELGKGVGVVTDMDKGAASGKGLENKREKGETPPNTQGLKPPKAQGWWESSTRGAPRRPREGWSPGGGERSQGKASSPCTPALLLSSLLAPQSSGRISAGPRGGIGCKQAPEYCQMEPAKAYLNQVRRRRPDSNPKPPQALPPTFCPILRAP